MPPRIRDRRGLLEVSTFGGWRCIYRSRLTAYDLLTTYEILFPFEPISLTKGIDGKGKKVVRNGETQGGRRT